MDTIIILSALSAGVLYLFLAQTNTRAITQKILISAKPAEQVKIRK